MKMSIQDHGRASGFPHRDIARVVVGGFLTALGVAVGIHSTQASVIPPHVDVVTHCGTVTSVYVYGPKGDRKKFSAENTKPAALEILASKAPRASWIEGGCGR